MKRILQRWRNIVPDKPTIQYENKFVGYIDILGFSDLIKRSESKPDLLEKLANVLSSIQEMWEEQYENSGLIVTSFSDNVILSADDSLQGFLHVAASIDWLANELLQQGVFIRGAIDYGPLYHDEKVVLGPVLGVVYSIEQTLAKFPRIVCSHAFISRIEHIARQSDSTKKYCDDFRRSAMTRDPDDGVCYLHILAGLERGINSPKDNIGHELLKKRTLDAVSRIVTFLQDGVDSHIENPGVYQKFKWFSEYWNSRVGGLVHDAKNAGLIKLTRGRLMHGVYKDYEYPYLGNAADSIIGSNIDKIGKD